MRMASLHVLIQNTYATCFETSSMASPITYGSYRSHLMDHLPTLVLCFWD